MKQPAKDNLLVAVLSGKQNSVLEELDISVSFICKKKQLLLFCKQVLDNLTNYAYLWNVSLSWGKTQGSYREKMTAFSFLGSEKLAKQLISAFETTNFYGC